MSRFPSLAPIAALLQDPRALSDGAKVEGTFEGQRITFALELETAGSYSTEVTVVSIPVPFDLPLLVSMRTTTKARQSEVEKGLAVDIVLGDPPFDQAYVVEGAPEHSVRTLFDERARVSLLAARPEFVWTTGKTLVLRIEESWIVDVDRARALLVAAARIGESLSRLWAREQASRVSAGDYRTGAPGAAPQDLAEIHALETLVARRKAETEKRALLVVGFAVTILLGLGLTMTFMMR